MKDFKELKSKIDILMNEKSAEISDIRNILSKISEYEENYLLNIDKERNAIDKKLKKDLELKIINQEEFRVATNKIAGDYYNKSANGKIKLSAPKGLYEKLDQYYDKNKEIIINIRNFNLTFEINNEHLITSYLEKLHYEKKINEEKIIIKINTSKHLNQTFFLEICVNNERNPEDSFYIIVTIEDTLKINAIYNEQNNIELDERNFPKNDSKILDLITWDSLLNMSPLELENLILITTDEKIDFSKNKLYASAQKGLNDFIKDLEIKNKIDRKITVNKKG